MPVKKGDDTPHSAVYRLQYIEKLITPTFSIFFTFSTFSTFSIFFTFSIFSHSTGAFMLTSIMFFCPKKSLANFFRSLIVTPSTVAS